MNKYMMRYAHYINPRLTEDDIEKIEELNDFDVLIVLKNKRKFIYDRFSNGYREVFYESINDITPEQELKMFAYNLRKIMYSQGVTQELLAAEIGTTQAMISRYTSGKVIPSVLIVKKIAKVLNCSMDDFFYKEY